MTSSFVILTTHTQLLNKSMPDDLKYDMHVLMFKLGQLVCTDSNPKCGSCPIKDLCRYVR